MGALENFTNPSCCDCQQYKPTMYTYVMNLTTTNILECSLQLFVAFLLIITYYLGSIKMKLYHQKSYQTYYLVITLIYTCHTIYSITTWLFYKHYNSNIIYFNQKISFYLVDQADILLNSFYLSVAYEKFQDFDDFVYRRLIARIINICNIILTLAFSIWLCVVVFYYNLCFEHLETYQISQLILFSICSISTIIILSVYVKQRSEQVENIKDLCPFIIFIILLSIGSILELLMQILRYTAEDWLSQIKYGHDVKELEQKFDDIIQYKLPNTMIYSWYDFGIYLFTVCSPLALFVWMYSNLRKINQNHMVNTID